MSDKTDGADELRIQIIDAMSQGSIIHEDQIRAVEKLIHSHTDKAVLEGRIDTARKILHSGWCIPDMEVQIEDYINTLQQQQEGKTDE